MMMMMITVMRSFLLKTLTGPVQCTVNSRYSRHCRDLESVSLLVRVRNSGVYFSQMSIIIYFCLGFRCCPFYWGVHYSGMFTRQELTYMQVIARRGVTSCYHSSKILESQQSLLTDMAICLAICIVERWKKSMGYHFVPGCNHAQESPVNFFIFFVFFTAIFAGAWFVEIQEFCYHGNMM